MAHFVTELGDQVEISDQAIIIGDQIVFAYAIGDGRVELAAISAVGEAPNLVSFGPYLGDRIDPALVWEWHGEGGGYRPGAE